MAIWRAGIESLALLLEALGVLFLFREVWRAQTAEGHHSNYQQLERIRQLMQRGDWIEAYAEYKYYEKPTDGGLAQHRATALGHGPTACQIAMQSAWQGGLDAKYEESWVRWIFITVPRNLEKRKWLYQVGSGLIIAGLLLQGLLLALRDRHPPVNDDSAQGVSIVEWRAALTGEGEVIRFDEAEAALRYEVDGRHVDLTPDVCRVKRSLAAAHVGGVLVVGRYDLRELRRVAKQRWSSNHALAQARADAVAGYLEASNDCGPAVGSVVRIVGGPRHTVSTRSADQLSRDRSVEVFGLVTKREVREEGAK